MPLVSPPTALQVSSAAAGLLTNGAVLRGQGITFVFQLSPSSQMVLAGQPGDRAAAPGPALPASSPQVTPPRGDMRNGTRFLLIINNSTVTVYFAIGTSNNATVNHIPIAGNGGQYLWQADAPSVWTGGLIFPPGDISMIAASGTPNVIVTEY